MAPANSLIEFNRNVKEESAILVYFENDRCNICSVLKPKLLEVLNLQFPKIKIFFIDVVKTPEIAAQYSVFNVPAILVFFEGKEFIRKHQVIGINEITSKLERPYQLLFG